MATAPEVQTSAPEATGKAMQISVNGKEYVIDFAALGPGDDLESRRQTGIPVTPFFDEKTIASDSMVILIWMARRKNGEPGLRFDRVLEEFPTYEHLAAANPKVVVVEDDSPEA